MNNPCISVVLGSYNRLKFLKLAIERVRQELKNSVHEIIVIDGGSTDGALEWLCMQKDIITIMQHNHGNWNNKPVNKRSWGYFMNLGFKIAQGKYICMISDDCLIVPGAIINGYKIAEENLALGRIIGAVAFYWREWGLWEKYRVNYTLGNHLYVNHGLYLTSALKDVGYADEETCFFYNGDGDICLKMWQKGYVCVESPDSYVEHYPHANVALRKKNHEQYDQDVSRYIEKWRGIFFDENTSPGMKVEKFYRDPHRTGDYYNLVHSPFNEAPWYILGGRLVKKIGRFLKKVIYK